MNEHRRVTIRTACEADLSAIIALLADDRLGAAREQRSDMAAYQAAFREIAADPNNELLVAERDQAVVGVLQLTCIRYLTFRGGRRAQIEGVRVAASCRGQGIGAQLIGAAIERARQRSCHLVQLTTDHRRPEALRFYERLGFANTHDGLKLHLAGETP